MDDNAFSLDNGVRLNVALEQLINKDGDNQQDSDEDVQVDDLIEISDVETNSGKHNDDSGTDDDDIYISMDDPNVQQHNDNSLNGNANNYGNIFCFFFIVNFID